MKLLLTSAGIKNPSIHDALVDLLGKPIAESTPSAFRPRRTGTLTAAPAGPWRFISGRRPADDRAGLEVAGRAGADRAAQHRSERWVPWVRETDVLLVNGGDALYLCHWMRESGLADLLPSLREKVWVGLSAGSMVLTPRIGEDFVAGSRPAAATKRWASSTSRSSRTWIIRTCRRTRWPTAERWAAGIPSPAYAIDDETAIKVVDGTVEVISEGHWKLFTPRPAASKSG